MKFQTARHYPKPAAAKVQAKVKSSSETRLSWPCHLERSIDFREAKANAESKDPGAAKRWHPRIREFSRWFGSRQMARAEGRSQEAPFEVRHAASKLGVPFGRLRAGFRLRRTIREANRAAPLKMTGVSGR